MLAPGSFVDLYCRVSTDDQADKGSSMDAQEAAGRATIERLGLMLRTVVRDPGQSSKSLDRPGFNEMMCRLDKGEIRGVVVAAVDRLTRNLADSICVVEQYFSGGAVDAWLIAEGRYVDTRSASGRLQFFIMVTVSQYQREIGVEKTRATLGHKRRSGERLGRDRFGYRVDPSQPARSRTDRPVALVVDEDDRQVRELVIEWRWAQIPYSEICRRLNERGFRPKRASSWAKASVAKIWRAHLDAEDAAAARAAAGEPATLLEDLRAELGV